MGKRLETYFSDYSSHHRTQGNKICHYLGIPMITATLLGLLARLTFGETQADLLRMDGGVFLLAIATIWYLILDWKLAVPFALLATGFYFLGRSMSLDALWTVFILGWVLQFVGHYKYEKKSPAFYKNLEHVLIGPLWIFARLIGRAR